MAVDLNVNVHKAGVQDIIQQSLSNKVADDPDKDDAADIARKKLVKKLAIKKEGLKNKVESRESFSREQQVNQKMQQIMGGAAGPEAAEGLARWEKNGDIQQKLTDAQKNMFREAMAKNPPKAAKAAKAMDNLSKQPEFKESVKSSQQMGTLQKGLLENPGTEKAAGQMLKNRFMKSAKSDNQSKSKFLDFGMKQAGKGNLKAVKQAGDLLGTLNKGNIGRSGQRATMNMVQRNPGDGKAMSNVDGFVSDPNVGKMPNFARTKGTELLAKSGGKEEVAEGFKTLAGEPNFQKQTAQNKGRFFSTIGTGRPSEFRQLSDTMLTSLQSPGFPKRSGQVGKFLKEVGKQVAKGGAKGVDSPAAMKKAKTSPMPKLSLVRMDSENMSEEEMQQARSQNRANVMQYYQKLTRMYEGGEKKLRSAKFLEDVNKMPTLRPPDEPDMSALTSEEQAFIKERHESVLTRHKSVQKLQRQRSRELRTKRRRGGKAGMRRGARVRGKQPRYFTPASTRGRSASEAFLQNTGTGGGPEGLPQTPQRGLRANRPAGGGGDIQSQVAAALSNISGPITAESAGQVAQAIASQVAQQVAAQVTESLLGAGGGGAPVESAPQPMARASTGAQPAKDGWGIPRNFDRDLGGQSRVAVKPPQANLNDGDGMTFQDAVSEKYTGKMLIKDPTLVRSLDELFSGATWVSLTKSEVALLRNLGWSQQMWDTKDTPAAKWPGPMMTAFVNLMPHQREATRKLGFTPHDWDTKVQAFTGGRDA